MSLKFGRRDLGIAFVVLMLAAIGLFVQHTRHGWPFSLHHGIGVAPLAPESSHAGHDSPIGTINGAGVRDGRTARARCLAP